MFKQTKKANQRQSAPFEIIAIVGAFDLSPNVPNLHFCTFSFFCKHQQTLVSLSNMYFFKNVQSRQGLDLGEYALNYKMLANSMKTMSKCLPNVIQCHPNKNKRKSLRCQFILFYSIFQRFYLRIAAIGQMPNQWKCISKLIR